MLAAERPSMWILNLIYRFTDRRFPRSKRSAGPHSDRPSLHIGLPSRTLTGSSPHWGRRRSTFLFLALFLGDPGRCIPLAAQSPAFRENGSPAELASRAAAARGQEKAELLLSLSNAHLLKHDPRASIAAAEALLGMANELRDKKVLVEAHLHIGHGQLLVGEFEAAVTHFERGRDLALKVADSAALARCQLALADARQHLGDHTESLRLASEALRLNETLDLKGQMAACYNTIGTNLFRLDRNQEARSAWEKGLELFQAVKDLRGESNALGNLSLLASARGEPKEALTLLRRTLEIRLALQDKLMLGEVYNNLAMIYQDPLKDFAAAEDYYLKSLATHETAGDPLGIARASVNLADLYLEWGRPASGRARLTRARELGEKLPTKQVAFSAYELEVAYAEREGNLAKALEWQRKLTALKEQAFQGDVAARVGEATARWGLEKKQRDLEAAQKDIALARTRLWALGGSLGILSLLVGVLWRHNRLKVRSELVLGEKNQQLERTLDELKVLRGIIPICCVCKKIRDDQGAWKQMEVYISTHSEARFSHGYCPACADSTRLEWEASGLLRAGNAGQA